MGFAPDSDRKADIRAKKLDASGSGFNFIPIGICLRQLFIGWPIICRPIFADRYLPTDICRKQVRCNGKTVWSGSDGDGFDHRHQSGLSCLNGP
jgi:hypothetical protein